MRNIIFVLVVGFFLFVQNLNIVGATDGDMVVLGKDNIGNLKIQSATDSTTAVQVLDADGGTPVLNVDTTNERVGIGVDAPEKKLSVYDNSAGATPIFSVDQASTGDASMRYTILGSAGLTVGIDNSDSDKFKWALQENLSDALMTLDRNGNVGIGTNSPVTTLDVNGSFALSITTPDLTGNTYTIAAGQYTVLLDDDDAQVTDTLVVTLPAAASNSGRILNLIKVGSSETVQLDGNSAETLNGALTKDLTVQYDRMQIQCDGSAWYILSSN